MKSGEVPSRGEKWTDIMADVESFVMPGITHRQHPRCVRPAAPFVKQPPDELYGRVRATIKAALVGFRRILKHATIEVRLFGLGILTLGRPETSPTN